MTRERLLEIKATYYDAAGYPVKSNDAMVVALGETIKALEAARARIDEVELLWNISQDNAVRTQRELRNSLNCALIELSSKQHTINQLANRIEELEESHAQKTGNEDKTTLSTR